MSLDVEKLFKTKMTQMRKEDQAKYFLARVDKVLIHGSNPDVFKAHCVRMDNGQRVTVVSKKSSSGQHFPEVNGVIRADKVSRLPVGNDSDVVSYKAEYFHAYRQDDLCLQGIIQASKPRKESSTNIWSAQVHTFDLDTNTISVSADALLTDLKMRITRALMPWGSEKQSILTHDIKGTPMWGATSEARPGFSPFVVLRFADQSFKIYGLGAVKVGEGNSASFRLPSANEVLTRVSQNANLKRIEEIAKTVDPSELCKMQIGIIPGLSIQVGRDSLGGEKQSYLAVPEAFSWVNRDKPADENGNHTSQPGFRPAYVHIKKSNTGRMLVVDAVPALGYLVKTLPLSKAEEAAKENNSEKASVSEAAAPATPAPTKPKAAASANPQSEKPAQEERQARAERSDEDSFVEAAIGMDERVLTDFDNSSFEELAEDFASMESGIPENMASDFEQDSSADDDLLQAAAELQSRRRVSPAMPKM